MCAVGGVGGGFLGVRYPLGVPLCGWLVGVCAPLPGWVGMGHGCGWGLGGHGLAWAGLGPGGLGLVMCVGGVFCGIGVMVAAVEGSCTTSLVLTFCLSSFDEDTFKLSRHMLMLTKVSSTPFSL